MNCEIFQLNIDALIDGEVDESFRKELLGHAEHCAACREMKDKRDLPRIVRSPEGEISLDPSGKRAGRGAYLCRKQACLKRLQKSRSLEKAFTAASS